MSGFSPALPVGCQGPFAALFVASDAALFGDVIGVVGAFGAITQSSVDLHVLKRSDPTPVVGSSVIRMVEIAPLGSFDPSSFDSETEPVFGEVALMVGLPLRTPLLHDGFRVTLPVVLLNLPRTLPVLLPPTVYLLLAVLWILVGHISPPLAI